MKCSIQGCPGRYEQKAILHTVKRGERLFVFENVPAEVCDVCSDTLLTPETIRQLEDMLKEGARPRILAPVYSYA